MTSYILRTGIAAALSVALRAALRVALLGCSLAALALTAAAQAQGQEHRSVRIAVPDSFPGRHGEPAVVIRTAADPLTPVVLLNRATLSEGVVASALATANLLLHRPIKAGETQVMGIASLHQIRPMSESAHALGARYLRQLQAQPTTRIGNVGAGRWIEVPAPTG
jgi:hypothetical protein